MAEQLGKEETVTVGDLLVSQSYEIAAIVSILEKKGIITKAEIIDEIKSLRNKA